VFDETNGSQVKEYDLDIIDDEEAPCDALQRMAIGEVRPQDPSKQQVVAPNDTTPLAQNHDQDDEDEKEEDKEDENEDEQDQPHDEDQDHDQEESNDQWGAKDDGVQERSKERPPHPRVRHTVQRDHPVDNIFGDIKKGVTIRSRVATFLSTLLFCLLFGTIQGGRRTKRSGLGGGNARRVEQLQEE
jgi:hypothetical protein